MGGVGFIHWHTEVIRFSQVPKNDLDVFCFMLFGCSDQRHLKASFRRVCLTVARKLLRFFDPCLEVLMPNVGLSSMFKQVKLNLASNYSGNLCLVDWCFWSCQNLLHQTKFLSICREISKSVWTDFWDGSGMKLSEVPLQTCWTFLHIFYKF